MPWLSWRRRHGEEADGRRHAAIVCAARRPICTPCTAPTAAPVAIPTSTSPSIRPRKTTSPASAASALNMTQVCSTCHADKFDQWQNSIHAALVRAGNPAAPVCTDCHNPHAVIKGAAASIDQVPCKKCHNGHLHRLSRQRARAKSRCTKKTATRRFAPAATPPIQCTPISVGRSPRVRRAPASAAMPDVLQAHEKWLPNAALHFQVVSCPACHVPNAQRTVDLMLIDSKSDQAREHRTDRRAAVRGQRSTRTARASMRRRCGTLLQTLDRSGLAGQDGRARPPGGCQRPADASARRQEQRRSASATPVTTPARRPSRA